MGTYCCRSCCPGILAAPIATVVGGAGGLIGGYAANKASEALTGRDIGTNVAMHTPLTPEMGEMLNPGAWYAAPRGMAVGDALQTALTGESRDFIKPLIQKYLGKPYYNNIRPSGYINNDEFAESRGKQMFNMFKDYMTPLFLRKNVSNTNYKPNWLVDKNNPTAFEMFRNDAHRLSIGLKPHQEILADGKPHSLYIKKENGKYDVDWDYIHHIKQNYSDADGRIKKYFSRDFPNDLRYIDGTNPSNGTVVANDYITGNGGFGTYTFNPKKLKNTNYNDGILPTHLSIGDVTFTDTWDVQPILDKRSQFPKFSKWLTKVSKKEIPVVSKAAENLKEVELVDAFGGHPFIQETKIPDKSIFWYPPKNKLKKFFTGITNKKNKPINILQW